MTVVLHPTRGPPLFEEARTVGAHMPYVTRMLIVVMNVIGFPCP
jgi:hypothetical protein